MKLRLLFLYLLVQNIAICQVPDTDIYLADLLKNGKILTIGNILTVTNAPGYDNKPSFIPGSNADIYIFDYSLGDLQLFKRTGEYDEYSPMITPDGHSISCVRVEPDST